MTNDQTTADGRTPAGPAAGTGRSGGRPLVRLLRLLRDLAGPTLRRLLTPRSDGPVTGQTAEARKAELAALGGRLGAAGAAHRARKVFASAERRQALDEEHMLRTAEEVTRTLGGMKGVIMKLGQMQSFLNDDLPPVWKDALAQLQADAPPMSGELAAQVIAEDLGRPPDELFAEWDPVPIAAASVGQVHRAITTDDRPVAVKVQYPGAAEALTGDLDNLEVFMHMAVQANAEQDPELPVVDLEPLVQEIRSRVVEEVDYRREARNQQLFADYFAGHPFISVPATVDELCGTRVLTTELVDGARFAELETWSQTERDLAGEAIFRFVYHSVFRLGAYNGDPHPGNYLFHGQGRVTFLDFGLVKTVDPASTEVLAKVFELGLVEQDPERFRKALEHAGFLRTDVDIPASLVFDQVARPWQTLLADTETVMPFPDNDMQRRPTTDEEKLMARAFTLPPTFLILMRTLIGLQALLARMGASRNWRHIAEEVWPFTERAAGTELGRLEAGWQAR